MNNIDTLHQILDLIEQHGVTVVLLVMVILLNIGLFRWLGNKFDTLWKSWVAIKGNLPDASKETVESVVVLNAKVKASLSQTLAETRADWAQLWQFHNGTHGVGKTKIPFMYISLTHEVCQDGCQEMRPDFMQLPLSMFDNFAVALLREEVLIHQWREGTQASGTRMGHLMHGFGAEMALIRAIRDEDSQVIGFLAVAFKEVHTFTEGRRVQFLNAAQRMAVILANDNQE